MTKSAFDLIHQNESNESKIVASLERISQAFKVLLWSKGKNLSVTPIQAQILIFLRYHTSDKRKVSYLANELNVTKATISNTIKTLEQKKLIIKEPGKDDTRSYLIHLTSKGKSVAEEMSFFAQEIQHSIERLPLSSKENLFSALLNIIYHLNQLGIISIQRMCFTCIYYQFQEHKQEHFCNLLNKTLADNELKIDCPEHDLNHSATR
ncbi:MAG: MarR family transcriptional regulator [Bacteroidetes bacterium]|nr:MAG: MarR family transcriptional regulator [Bacteroidota bacterium]